MPKEVLHDDSGLRALVKWRRDREREDCPDTPGHVQIATVNPGIDDPDNTGTAGWYVDLDADQIDYLIAVLRKAKRQAFPQPTHPGGMVTMVHETVLQPIPAEKFKAFADELKRANKL